MFGGKLGNCSRLKDSKETRKLDPGSKKKGTKDIIEENEKFEYGLYVLDGSIVST